MAKEVNSKKKKINENDFSFKDFIMLIWYFLQLLFYVLCIVFSPIIFLGWLAFTSDGFRNAKPTNQFNELFKRKY